MASEPSALTTKGTGSSSVCKELFGELYQEQSEFDSKSKLQTGADIIGRMLTCVKPRKQTISY